MTVFLGHGSPPCVGRGRMVGSAGRHTDLRRPLALPGAAVSHGVLPVMAWEGPGSRPRGTAPRTTDATVPLGRKNASTEGRAKTPGRDAPWQHGGPWPRITALRGTWCMRGPGASCEESAWLQGERHATGRSARERRARHGVNSAGEPSGLICVTNRPILPQLTCLTTLRAEPAACAKFHMYGNGHVSDRLPPKPMRHLLSVLMERAHCDTSLRIPAPDRES
jgi:hypothetical protein